jgi:hypothetical protein
MTQDQPSEFHERPVDAERAHKTLRTMSDSELAELHGQGRDGLRVGAWEIVDQEIRRRARVKVRQESEARVIEDHDDEERYPALRAIVFQLKAIAVVALLIAVIGAAALVFQTRAGAGGPLLAFLCLGAGVVVAISYWASAELFVLLMDIERNTRSMRRN